MTFIFQIDRRRSEEELGTIRKSGRSGRVEIWYRFAVVARQQGVRISRFGRLRISIYGTSAYGCGKSFNFFNNSIDFVVFFFRVFGGIDQSNTAPIKFSWTQRGRICNCSIGLHFTTQNVSFSV